MDSTSGPLAVVGKKDGNITGAHTNDPLSYQLASQSLLLTNTLLHGHEPGSLRRDT